MDKLNQKPRDVNYPDQSKIGWIFEMFTHFEFRKLEIWYKFSKS